MIAEPASASEETPAPVFDRSWQATPSNVTRSCRAVLEFLSSAATSDATLDAIGAAITEVTTNSVYHAYVGRRVGHVRLTAAVLAEQIVVSVEDDGCGFDSDEVVPGSGLALIGAFADQVRTSRRPAGGQRTTMWFARADDDATG